MRLVKRLDIARLEKIYDSIKRAKNDGEVNLEKFLRTQVLRIKGELKTLDGELMVEPESRFIYNGEIFGPGSFLPSTWEIG